LSTKIYRGETCIPLFFISLLSKGILGTPPSESWKLVKSIILQYYLIVRKILLIILSILVLSPILYSSNTFAEDDLKTIRVGVYDNYPKIYKDSDGEIKGFWADITNYIAEEEGWEIVYIYDTWENGLENLKTGNIDMMVDVAVSDERLTEYEFNNETILLSWGVFYTRKGLEINSFSDLEGKNIAIMTSGIHYSGPFGLENVLSSFGINANIVDVDVYSDVFELLQSGDADVGVVSWFFGVANEGDYDVERTNIMFDPSELKYAFTKGAEKNEYLISVIDYNINKLKEDRSSVYYNSIQTNFTEYVEEIEVTPNWLDDFIIIMVALGLITIMILVLMGIYQRKLKKDNNIMIQRIKESESRYRELYDSSYDAVVTLDSVKWKFTSGNRAAIKMFDVQDEKELCEKEFIDFSPKEQPDGELSSVKSKQIVKETLEKGSSLFEWTHQTKDGKEFPTFVLLAHINSKGKKYLQATIRDISDKKEAEKKLIELNMLRNKFIDVVSHQLRTPLTSLKWSIERLLGENSENLTIEQQELLQTIYSQQDEVIKRVNDMIETIDIEEGRVAFNLEEISLDSLLKSVLSSIMPKAKVKDLKIHTKIDSKQTFLVKVDMKKIRTVLEHLINNAISYTKNKGNISISLVKKGKVIRFEIIDDGIGIPLTEQGNIFTRFFRASNASLVKTDASGLGLAISKYYILQHKGSIGFTSTEGKGSTFWFELPMKN